MKDLLFVSLENWDEVWRRNQFLCAGLARRFPNMKILFVGLPRDASHNLRRGKVDLRREALQTVPEYPNITLLRPLKLLPNTLAWGRRFNEAHARRQIQRAARKIGLQNPILWLNPHSAVHMAGRMGERAVVYDITDDWIEAAASAAEKERIAAQDASLCRRADAVIVCSERLFELKRGLAHHLHLIPNGVNMDHYQSVSDSGPLPEETRDWPKPVLGYTGTLHPERVAVALIETLARRFSTGTIALVGPNMLPPSEEARLRRCGNVRLTGAVPYARLPDYMRAFDVCITPHRMTPFTESLNPIKLWEYLAGGKPIVSTDIAGFRDYPQLVRLASNIEDFVAQCQSALIEGGSGRAARQAEAADHSWNARLDTVLAVLGPLEAKKPA